MLVLEKTNPENLTNSAIETELKYLWEQVINLEIAVSVIRDCDVELDKFNIRKNLYNQQSKKDNEIYLIKERIADLDDVRIIRTGLSFILEPENINKRLEIIESYQKHSVMGEDTFNYIENFSINQARQIMTIEKNKMTMAELEKIENAFSDIRMARDFLNSLGYDVGGSSLNAITDMQYSLELPEMEDCIDWGEVNYDNTTFTKQSQTCKGG